MKKELSQIDILVNPGEGALDAEFDTSEGVAHVSGDNNIDEDRLEYNAYRMLFDAWLERARQLDDNAVIVVITDDRNMQYLRETLEKPVRDESFNQLGDEELPVLYQASLYKDLRKILGRRLIVVTDISVKNHELLEQNIRRIAESRGFSINSEAEVFVYGESLGYCVEEKAEAFQNFAGEVTIVESLTDKAVDTEDPEREPARERATAKGIRYR